MILILFITKQMQSVMILCLLEIEKMQISLMISCLKGVGVFIYNKKEFVHS